MALTTQDFVAAAKAEITECDVQQAAEKIKQGSLALDVREPQEFMQGHIPSAIDVPRGVLEFRVDAHPQLQNKDQEIIVYCQAGGRGALATKTLQEMGFTKVINMIGGYAAWSEAGLDQDKDPAEWS
ncbi:rhodanese-like domain-containing protein [Oceanospirillum sanctuarii]|uniref:rhodanese-like domain-containing protein n=1 Tax=Oceanospirillum sanctuarii TaxID=1434821 RepID=UPI000A38770E|nr:rhodanese-like domain-containing protein [Oceanospirillum sanctuarii]